MKLSQRVRTALIVTIVPMVSSGLDMGGFAQPNSPRGARNIVLEVEAANIKATSITLPANHLAMLSHPREVAELIEQAAAKAK